MPNLLIVPDYEQSAFTSLIQARAGVGQELRFDDILSGDLYHGRAPDGTLTSLPKWEVVRFYRDAQAVIQRVRYIADIAWDDRTNAANWP